MTPIEARDALGVKAGSKLQIRLKGNHLALEKTVALDLSRWVGKAVDDGLGQDEALAELRGRPVPGRAKWRSKGASADRWRRLAGRGFKGKLASSHCPA